MPKPFKFPSYLMVFLCAFLPLIIPERALAQAAPAPISDPNAVALAGRALQALAGGTALTDITLEGNATYIAGSDEETGAATLVARGNFQSLLTLNLSGGTRQEIRNGPSGVRSGPDGVQSAMALHNCWVDAPWFFPSLILQALQGDPTLGVVYLGPAVIPLQPGTIESSGVAALHLQFFHLVPGQTPDVTAVIQGLSTVDLYVDPKSLLPLALDFNTHPDDNFVRSIPVEIRLADYQPAGGILVPFRIQRFLQGTLALDLAVSQTAINSGVPASMFTLPLLPSGGAQ